MQLTFRTLVGGELSLTEEQQQELRNLGVLHISHGEQECDLSHLHPLTTPKQGRVD